MLTQDDGRTISMNTRTKEDYEKIKEYRNTTNRLAIHLGIRITEVREGYCEGCMEYRPELGGSNGAIHGGALCTMIDTVGGTAAASHGDNCTTSTITIQYLRASRSKGKLRCVARELKAGKRICSIQAEVYDEDGTLLTVALCEYVRIPSMPIL